MEGQGRECVRRRQREPRGERPVQGQLHPVRHREAAKPRRPVLTATDTTLRTAGKIADYIYQKLLGAACSPRLSYVIKTGNRYQLQISDSDGQNARIALSSTEPIISPSGRRAARRSRMSRSSARSRSSTSTTCRPAVASSPTRGNSAPAGRRTATALAVALSLTGNTQIYTSTRRAAACAASESSIDTEPFYSPDGRWIYFTSDRGGAQIYRMPAQGESAGAAQLTFTGSYNTSPRISRTASCSPSPARVGLQAVRSGSSVRRGERHHEYESRRIAELRGKRPVPSVRRRVVAMFWQQCPRTAARRRIPGGSGEPSWGPNDHKET